MVFCCAYGIYIIPPFTAVQPNHAADVRHHSVTEHDVYIHQYHYYTLIHVGYLRGDFVVVFFFDTPVWQQLTHSLTLCDLRSPHITRIVNQSHDFSHILVEMLETD